MELFESTGLFVFMRVIHLLAIVLWIGGVAFVTTVLIPALKKEVEPKQRLYMFELLESKFSFQAKIVTVCAGVSGFWMTQYLDAWDRFSDLEYWWMHIMVAVWTIFTLVLFVFEPLFLHKWFHKKAEEFPQKSFEYLHRLHVVLLTLSLIAVAGAVAGIRGYSLF